MFLGSCSVLYFPPSSPLFTNWPTVDWRNNKSTFITQKHLVAFCCFSHWTYVAPQLARLICSPVRALRRKGAAIPQLHTWTFPKGALQFKPLHKKITGCSSQNDGKWGMFFSYSLFDEVLLSFWYAFIFGYLSVFQLNSAEVVVSATVTTRVLMKIIAVSS